MIVKTAFRQGNTHTMFVAEWKEKEENDPTVGQMEAICTVQG